MTETRKVDLALQGGGSHGAFTWGVLDRLLEEEWIEIAGVSGTSAGAMNAVALVNGLADGGPDRARALLRDFWERVSLVAAFNPVQRTPFDVFFSGWRLDKSPMYRWMEIWSQFLSPYQFNPFGFNPLRRIVDEMFDFDVINDAGAPRLFQSASNVRTGHLDVFRQPEISVETTLASACLPTIYQAVEIGDEAYWDGGYMGNPPLYPLARESPAKDLILVQINPFYREDVPRRVADINNRLNEMIFNSSLLNELRAAGLFYGILKAENVELDGFGQGRLHRIADEETMRGLGVSSKMNAAPDFLHFLFDKGRAAADAWLAAHGPEIGMTTTWLPEVVLEQLQGVMPAKTSGQGTSKAASG